MPELVLVMQDAAAAMSRWELLAVFVGGPAAIIGLVTAVVLGFTDGTDQRQFPILRPDGVQDPTGHAADPPTPSSGVAPE